MQNRSVQISKGLSLQSVTENCSNYPDLRSFITIYNTKTQIKAETLHFNLDRVLQNFSLYFLSMIPASSEFVLFQAPLKSVNCVSKLCIQNWLFR